MSNNDNKWEQPEAPPPPLFTGKKEKDLVKQVTDELIERVVGISVLYYPISLKHSNFHPLYGEAIDKTYLPPVHVEVLAEWEGEDTTTTGFGIDKKSSVTLHFHKRRLTEDQNLFVREGDFVQYGEQKYEIVTLGQPRQLFGQPEAKIEVVAKCVRARDGSFPSEAYAEPGEDEDPRLTAPACDPIEEIRVLTGDTTSTGGSGTQPCGEVYERPGNPPPPLFTGAKEGALVKQVGDEILERVVGQQIVYFPVSVPHSNFHELYGESINKTFLPPLRVFAAVEWKGSDTTTTNYGIDRKSAIDVKFHKRRLTEDQNLFVREGDFVLYGSILYEIATVGQPRLLFGKIDEKYEVVATCIRAREGTFKLSEVPGTDGDFDLDSVTACENANIVTPSGVDNTMANVGTGEGVFKNKVDGQFNMKTILAGDDITVTATTDEITIGLSSSITVDELTASGFSMDGHIIPTGDAVYDIGDALHQIRDLYISTGSIVFGGTHKIEVNSDTNTFSFDSPGSQGLTIPCVDTIPDNDYSDGTILYHKGEQAFKFRQNSEWFTVGEDKGSTIGAAEDSSYQDGIFTDFIPSTPVGTAVDRFNEILKILAPSPAPDVSKINTTTPAGVSTKLSFGSSSPIEGYTNVADLGSLSEVDVAGTYETVLSSDDLRRGTYAGATDVNGVVNFHITADTYDNAVNNYPEDSFGNADLGTLELHLNGQIVQTIDLSATETGEGQPGSGTGTHLNSSGSGFFEVSAPDAAEDRSQNQFDVFQHRTAKYRVSATEQVNGLNYAEVAHSGSWGRKITNHIQWVNDADSAELAANNFRFENESGTGSKFLSGVEYFTGGTADYIVEVDNAYRNVYTSQNITFNTSNCSIPSQAFPDLDVSAGEDKNKVLRITGSATITASNLLGGSMQASVNVAHPLKPDLSSAGSATSTGILTYAAAGDSTELREKFKEESFRLKSGDYEEQSDISSGTWNSESHMLVSDGYDDGLQFFDAKLCSPLHSTNSGDFRDDSEGGTLGLAPPGNPDYSSVAGTRTFYRYFKNNSAQTRRDLTLTIKGDSTTIVSSDTTLNSERIRVFVKIPGTTGFMDVATEFSIGSVSDTDGAHIAPFDNTLDSTNYVAFGSVGVLNGDSIVLKIEADASWTGHVDDIEVTFGAGVGPEPLSAPALNDIDINDNGSDAKLSFGSSKPILGYSSVSTNTGLSPVDVNEDYLSSGTNIAGIFDGTTVIDGDLNESVSANGTSHTSNAFGDAHMGLLKLEVNGEVLHTLNLADPLAGEGNPGSGTFTSLTSNTGFTNLSNYAYALYSGNNVPDYTKTYRTGKYQIDPAHQRSGWNYARVIHTLDSGDAVTNYVEWVNDPEDTSLSAHHVVLDDFAGDEIYSMSGVQYFITCSSSYRYGVDAAYKNVYYRSGDAISFPTTTNSSISKITTSGAGLQDTQTISSTTRSLPELSFGENSQDETLYVTGTVVFGPSESLVGPHATTTHTVSVDSKIRHPIKSDLTTNNLSKSNFLVFQGSETGDISSTEPMDGEVYRLQAGQYSEQLSVTDPQNKWDSTVQMNSPETQLGHANGLLLYNNKLISPKSGGLNGDYRAVADGGLLQAPPNNPNYSSLTYPVREYYRYFKSDQIGDVSLATITLAGDAKVVARGGFFNLGTVGADNNIHCEVKIPGDTGWLDIARPASVSEDITQDVGGFNGGGSDVDQIVDQDGTSYGINFRTATLNGTSGGSADYLIVRITAHEDWTGHLSRIFFTYGT